MMEPQNFIHGRIRINQQHYIIVKYNYESQDQ